MNTFCLSGQDISWIDLAWVVDDKIVHTKRCDGKPEAYLGCIDTVLQAWSKQIGDIDRVLVVRGPGSFTANRIGVTIGNTLSFIQDIPICGVKNTEQTPLKQFLERIDWNALSFTETFVVPYYDRPPGITKPRNES